MGKFKYIFVGLLIFSICIVEAQTESRDVHEEFEIEVEFTAKDNHYIVKLHKNPSLFYFYIISGEPIPELDDKDIFIHIVDSESNGWPVVEAGYIDTRYGVNEFTFDLTGKNFYLMATNGEEYSKVNKYNFR
jgi:hypothetical protein